MGDHATHGGQRLTAPDEDEAAPAEEAALEAGRRLFAQDCQFVAGAAARDALPPIGLPEVAFAGRSNVGKSSLINALTGRKTLARVSHTPGRTQQLNFFDLGGRLMLVDLPGYGFARAAKSRIKEWTGVTESYLKGRPTLRRLCLLVDSRHGLKASDRDVMAMLDSTAQSYQLVLTKVDEVKPGPLAEHCTAIAAELARHPAAHPQIIATSARSGVGVADLRAALAALAIPD
ncbi:ribosome biogenesis GTP-binding protein YihA/YsxC [Rhodospirillaceae bacterium SYSU D60014]|uniref:ribosome biogenesis GTP-binding protein YihA/YsxC n=1 Tax=Virgifigura deserti TaxID=2268457 RepID=UPI000E66316E